MICIAQHHPAESPGFINAWAQARGVPTYIWHALHEAPPVYSADPIILLGGPYSVNDDLPFLRRERAWLQSCVLAGAPVFAICMGAQLLAQTLGASVRRLANPETGWCTVDVLGQSVPLLQWHEEAFDAPTGAHGIASNGVQACQAFAHGQHIGVQFHAEWTPAIVAELNQQFPDSPLRSLLDDADPRFTAAATILFNLLDRWHASAQAAKR
jgi:GMP synthase-like glutamine amidotransferase